MSIEMISICILGGVCAYLIHWVHRLVRAVKFLTTGVQHQQVALEQVGLWMTAQALREAEYEDID